MTATTPIWSTLDQPQRVGAGRRDLVIYLVNRLRVPANVAAAPSGPPCRPSRSRFRCPDAENGEQFECPGLRSGPRTRSSLSPRSAGVRDQTPASKVSACRGDRVIDVAGPPSAIEARPLTVDRTTTSRRAPSRPSTVWPSM